MAFRLYDNPEETLEEALQAYSHDCSTAGHVLVPDWNQDLQWNEHFILIPTMCRICYLKTFKVLSVTMHVWSEAYKSMEGNLSITL